MACWRPLRVPTVRWCAMSARRARLRSSSRTRFGSGSALRGGGSRARRSVEEEDEVDADADEDEDEDEREKGRRGVEGRGAAAGAERRAERALSWGSLRSWTRIWSWNWRRAMMRAEVWWLTP